MMKWTTTISHCLLLPALLISSIGGASSDQTTTQTPEQFDQPPRLKSTSSSSPLLHASSASSALSSNHHELSTTITNSVHHQLPTSLPLVAEEQPTLSSTRNGASAARQPISSISKLPPSPPAPLHRINCRQLRMGQFLCPQAEIDLETQQPAGCTAANLAPVNCTLREGLVCDDDASDVGEFTGGTFEEGEEAASFQAGANASTVSKWTRRRMPPPPRLVSLAVACDHTNGYSFEVTLLLSIFLGFLGADRFYLGYGALGLLKLSTLGFLFLGHFVDILLIAMQIVLPADGSAYIIKQYGPRLNILRSAGGSPLPSPAATRVFESQYEHYFYWPTAVATAAMANLTSPGGST